MIPVYNSLPKSLISFQRMFPDEAACAAWLFSMRWPEGFQCPGCGHDHGWALRAKAHTFECTSCHRQTSVTAGTILHGSKLDLTVWFWAAYLMATHSNGISALQLQKQLALGSYRTAWMLAAKLRRAMVDPDRNPLSGLVEIDETPCLSGPRTTPPAAAPGEAMTASCSWSVASRWGDGNKPGRLRLAALTDYGAGSLNAFIARNIAPASTAKTMDGPDMPASPSTSTIPTSSAPWPHILSCPGSIRCSPTSRLGPWGRSRAAQEIPANLSRRVRLPLQPTQNAARHLPLPVRHRHPRQTCHLQHVGCAGTKCISGRPDIPLHTNGSENDIRCQVTRRKISGGTRSETGRDCRDAFLGLMKTCDKLGVSFWDYLGSRLDIPGAPPILPLPDLIRQRAAA